MATTEPSPAPWRAETDDPAMLAQSATLLRADMEEMMRVLREAEEHLASIRAHVANGVWEWDARNERAAPNGND